MFSLKRFVFLALIIGVATPIQAEERIDEVPMYGGINRNAVPELKAGDEKFISDVTTQFGSRERASVLWVNQGYKFYNQDQLGMAMRRFNQAWLLNPKNPETYTGFGSVLTDQGKNCDAMKMMEKASLHFLHQNFKAYTLMQGASLHFVLQTTSH